MHFLSGENGIVYNYTAGDLFLTVHDPDNLDYCNDVSLSISDLVKANIMVEEQCRKSTRRSAQGLHFAAIYQYSRGRCNEEERGDHEENHGNHSSR